MGILYRYSWSHSRRDLLTAACQKSIFFEHFSVEEPFEADAKRLKALTNVNALAGNIVDQAIADFLTAHRQGEDRSADFVDRGVQMFERAVAASRDASFQIRNGQTSGAATAILHHDYYAYGCSASFIKDKADRVRRCLQSFHDSDICRRLSRMPPHLMILPRDYADGTPSFYHGNVRIVVNPDFMIPFKERMIIFDWKSGVPTGESLKAAQHQLTIYAMFAMKKRKVPLDQIWLQAVWLADHCSWDPWQTTEQQCSVIEQEIVSFRDDLSAKLSHGYDRDGHRAMTANMRDFPASPTDTRCFNCKFREICSEGKAQLDILIRI